MDGRERAAAARSTAAAVSRVSDAVEGVSAVIRRRVRTGLSIFGPAAAPMGAVDATHAFVHGTIRVAAPLAGTAVGYALERTAPPDAPSFVGDDSSAGAASALAAAFGDQLPDELVPTMSWRIHEGADVGPDMMVFIHGLGGHGGQWGSQYLAVGTASGFTPVTVTYNTGLPITDNAALFHRMMSDLVAGWPGGVRRIVLVAHSMGGLVATAAYDHADGADSPTADRSREQGGWTEAVTDVVTLSTPHKGAPLERVSDLALRTIALSETAAPVVELGHHRSRGIKDLAEGWHSALPADVRHHAIAAYLGGSPDSPVAVLLGDGLVRPDSAAGRSSQSDSVTVIALGGTNHNALLDHADVRAILERVVAA